MEINIQEDRVAVILDAEEIVRGVVQGKKDSAKMISAIELCLSREYGAVDSKIQKIDYFSFTDVFNIVVHLWINEEGGPPNVYEFRIQKSVLY